MRSHEVLLESDQWFAVRSADTENVPPAPGDFPKKGLPFPKRYG